MKPSGIISDTSILLTKLYKPRLTSDLVKRKRLEDLISDAGEIPFILITAPAGYGKSTLVSNWLDCCENRHVWISLDESDSDINEFLKYLVAAFDYSEYPALLSVKSLLQSHETFQIPVIASMMSGDFEKLDQTVVIVLDDYHRLAPSSPVHDLITILIEHPSKRTEFIISTRRNPPLPVAPLIATGKALVIRMNDLMFIREETIQFLAQSTDIEVSEEALNNLDHEIEGWAAGLRLVFSSLRNIPNPDQFISGLNGGIQGTQEYLVDQVLKSLPESARNILIRISIVDRFCSELVISVNKEDNDSGFLSTDFMDWLKKNIPFTLSLDHDGKWYRFHHLFRELLRKILAEDFTVGQIADLHWKASVWFENKGLIEEALNHAFAAGRTDVAISLFAKNRYKAMDSEQWHRLDRWVDIISGKLSTSNPLIEATKTIIYEIKGSQEFLGQMNRVDAMINSSGREDEEDQLILAETSIFKALGALVAGQADQVFQLSEYASERIPEDALHVRSYIVGLLALGNQCSGDLDQCLSILDDAENSISANNVFYLSRLKTWRCYANILQGRLRDVIQPALKSIQIGMKHQLPESVGHGLYMQGIAHYLMNELDAAKDCLEKLCANRYTSRIVDVINGSAVLALVHLYSGHCDESDSVIEILDRQVIDSGDQAACGLVQAVKTELAWRKGHFTKAATLSTKALFEWFPPIWFFYIPQFTPIKMKLSSGTAEALSEAETQLELLILFVRSTCRRTVLIEALGIKAAIKHAVGDETAALEALEESLELADECRNIRGIVDLGSFLTELLPKIQGSMQDFANRLLLTCESMNQQSSACRQPSEAENSGITNREQDVLELLKQRMQDKEIADHLCISASTIRQHLKNIYKKLDVHGRQEAVYRATEMGILKL